MDPLVIVIAVVIALVAVGVVVGVRTRRGPGSPTAVEDVEAAPPPPPPPPPPPAPPVAAPPGLRDRLSKTRRAFADRVAAVLGRDHIDAELWSDLEDSLVAADVGVAAASRLVDRVKDSGPEDGPAARAALERELVALLADRDRALDLSGQPAVILVVGVNGTGKTTSIAKLASRLTRDGKTVLLGAADTFRAAADEQLRRWADRVGVPVVSGQTGADPASVAFDAYQAARARSIDVVIVDTAGRLQTKANLMDELSKVTRVLNREAGSLGEVLLVLDGTTGQNGISQARSFADAVGLTGIVLTKLDGTARGGVAIAVEQELGIPVKFIGVGEGVDDLVPFDASEFVDALLGV